MFGVELATVAEEAGDGAFDLGMGEGVVGDF